MFPQTFMGFLISFLNRQQESFSSHILIMWNSFTYSLQVIQTTLDSVFPQRFIFIFLSLEKRDFKMTWVHYLKPKSWTWGSGYEAGRCCTWWHRPVTPALSRESLWALGQARVPSASKIKRGRWWAAAERWVSEVAPWVKALVTLARWSELEPQNPHDVRRITDSTKMPFDLHMCAVACTHTHAHAHVRANTVIIITINK